MFIQGKEGNAWGRSILGLFLIWLCCFLGRGIDMGSCHDDFLMCHCPRRRWLYNFFRRKVSGHRDTARPCTVASK